MSMREKLTVSRIAAYVLGLFSLALGIAASVRSNLGSSPGASIPYMLNLTTGLEFGTATFLWLSFLVFVQIFIQRHEFSPWILMQLITSFVFGYLNSFANWIFSLFPAPESIIVRAFLTCFGFVVGGLGVWLYSSADLINMPSEGIAMTLAKKLKKPFHIIKIAFDITCVALSCICCLVFIRSIGSFGIGTVVIAVMMGTMVGFYEKHCGNWLRKEFAKGKVLFM